MKSKDDFSIVNKKSKKIREKIISTKEVELANMRERRYNILGVNEIESKGNNLYDIGKYLI